MVNNKLLQASNRRLTLERASKEYLDSTSNNQTISKEGDGGFNSSPVIFRYDMGMRRVVGVSMGIISLVVPDGCICLLVGRQIDNPVCMRYRVRVLFKDIKGFGLRGFVSSCYHSVRIKVNRLVRRVRT